MGQVAKVALVTASIGSWPAPNTEPLLAADESQLGDWGTETLAAEAAELETALVFPPWMMELSEYNDELEMRLDLFCETVFWTRGDRDDADDTAATKLSGLAGTDAALSKASPPPLLPPRELRAAKAKSN